MLGALCSQIQIIPLIVGGILVSFENCLHQPPEVFDSPSPSMISQTLPHRRIVKQLAFVILIAVCLFPFITPPIALAVGLFFGWLFNDEPGALHRTAARILLQASVVGLGFGIDLLTIVEVSQVGIGFTIAVVFVALLLGTWGGRRLGLSCSTTHLISSGTAICGGSAIAALGPVVKAEEQEMSVALGTVFMLNAVALFSFPFVAQILAMTPLQFGVWTAIAIHDTSSVVGAAARHSSEALAIATTVKLGRTLWLIPLLVLTGVLFRGRTSGFPIPFFVTFFVVASFLRTVAAPIAEISPTIVSLARIGLTITLFLIGSMLTRRMVRNVGAKPFVHGAILWIVISLSSLLAVVSLL